MRTPHGQQSYGSTPHRIEPPSQMLRALFLGLCAGDPLDPPADMEALRLPKPKPERDDTDQH